MLLLVNLILCLAVAQAETPLKPRDEFRVDLKLELKQKPVSDRYHVDLNENATDRTKRNSSMIPYMVVNLTLLKLSELEVRVKGRSSNNEVICNKKAEEGLQIKLDLGFTDDIKDGVTAREFNIFTIDSKRKQVYRIHLLFLEDGTFLVNNEVRGKI